MKFCNICHFQMHKNFVNKLLNKINKNLKSCTIIAYEHYNSMKSANFLGGQSKEKKSNVDYSTGLAES